MADLNFALLPWQQEVYADKTRFKVVVAGRHDDLMRAFGRNAWPCELLSNGHIRVEHSGEDLNPLLRLMHSLEVPPVEIIPSPNALEEMFVKALAENPEESSAVGASN